MEPEVVSENMAHLAQVAASPRCPSCRLTADGRDELGALVFGCCLDGWHDTHRPTAEQQAEREREVAELMRDPV